MCKVKNDLREALSGPTLPYRLQGQADLSSTHQLVSHLSQSRLTEICTEDYGCCQKIRKTV